MRLPLLVFAGLCAALALVVYVIAFDTGRGLGWDVFVLQAATAKRDIPSVQDASSGLIDTIDIASLVLLGGGIVGVALLLGRRRTALAAALLVAGANATTQALKPALGHLHPFGDPRAQIQSSFPSGHATVAMSIALAAVLVAPAGWKVLVALAGAAYAAGVGISLLVQASHYPSDVAGAYLLTGAWAGAMAALLMDRPGEAKAGSRRSGLIAAGLAVAAFGVVVAVAVDRHPGIVFQLHAQTKLVFALVVLAGLALAVCAGFAILLQATALRSVSTTRS
jgi:membrane-associated phospholipid phosphatase